MEPVQRPSRRFDQCDTLRAAIVLLALVGLGCREQPRGSNQDDMNDRHAAGRELLKRHLAKGSTLGQLASSLSGAPWLAATRVEKVEALGGELPVAIPAGGAVFVVRLDADSGVYLALDRDLEPSELRDVLMSKNRDGALARIRLLDFSFFP